MFGFLLTHIYFSKGTFRVHAEPYTDNLIIFFPSSEIFFDGNFDYLC